MGVHISFIVHNVVIPKETNLTTWNVRWVDMISFV